MKTLEELVKELNLRPNDLERFKGRIGNYVHIYENEYVTFSNNYSYDFLNVKVIEVKPE
jgi:hypothetical protein